MFETITALATAPLKSALHIIRVSGDDCFDVVSKCFSKDIRDIKERTLLVGKIVDGSKVVDEVVLAIYKGPKSFTGEDLVEIMCHGSLLIANEIIELLLSKGARLAVNGEFSSRAFLHNRIDLIQAEAINDVINATTKEAKELSLLSLKGETSKLIIPIRVRIADILSLIEVNIDYPEYEDIEVANKNNVIDIVDELIPQINKLVDEGEKGLIIKEGINVALVGKPNVGKSSLLNALLGEEKAIVTPIPGTTRDVVEGDINLFGITLHLLDTAGIRESEDTVESIGVNKSRKSIESADLVLVVIDSSSHLTKEDEEVLELTKNSNRIIIYNKADKAINKNYEGIYVSALNHDVEALRKAIYDKYGINEETFKRPSLNNTRQLGLLNKAVESLSKAINDAQNDLPVDLIAVSLTSAYHAILEILGEDMDIDLSKEIFKRFCVGK